MKKYFITSIFAFFLLAGSAFAAQTYPEGYLGLPGDNLNLYAVMNVFQESETLEAFERKLNDPEEVVNKLDLNNDGYVDYIMVNDYQYENGDVHNIVMSVALNQNENQDVAVIVVEKKRDGSVMIQLIGDEALYGKNYIIEPQYAETPNPGYRGNVVRTQANVVHTTYYEVASWPVIVYLTRPVYRPWRSVWYWGYYPHYWSPWRAHYWHYYYGYHYPSHSYYYAHYRPWRHYRANHYHRYYYPTVRRHSPLVVVNINRGVYKETYSRPETRREGEALYAHRSSTSGRVPGGNRSAGTINNRSNAAQTPEAAVTAPRQGSERREATPAVNTRSNERTQSREATQPASNVNERRSSEGGAVRTQTPANSRRETTTTPARKTAPAQTEQRSAPARTAPAAPAQRPQTPAKTNTRPATNQREDATRTAPAATGSRQQTPDRKVTRPAASQRSAPANVSTRNASRAPRVQQAEPARSSSSRVSTPSRNERSNRSSGTVRSNSGSSNRSSGTVRSNSSRSTRSSGTTRSSGSSTKSNERSRR